MAAVVLAGCGTTFTLPRTNNLGFGDRQNDYAWGMAWFNGKLYVGTSRNEMCVEGATTQYYDRFSNPSAQDYTTAPGPGVTCPADQNALYQTLQAEIWQYDPSKASPSTPQSGWTRVYQSPAVQNPALPTDPTKTIGRDIAFRAATVVTLNGVSTLLFSGVTAGEFLRNTDGSPQVPAPRLLATTDGTTFHEYPYTGQINITGWQLTPPLPQIHYPMGFRSVVQIGTHIFALASDSLTGDGVVMEFNPSTGAFTQISALRVFEIESFNNQLYLGTADPTNGYGVYRSNLASKDANGYYTFTNVITGGAGRGGFVATVISMHPFKGRLYVGSCGWLNGGGCELIRINPDDTWDLDVGAGRTYNGVAKSPISGYIDGFNNFFNVHFWRIGDHDGALYVGTNDASWLFQTNPALDPLLSFQYGFDIFGSCDGQSWTQVTNNGLNDDPKHNFGARNFADSVSPDLAFVGSANHASGTGVYQIATPTFCGTTTTTTTTAPKTASAASVLAVPAVSASAPAAAAPVASSAVSASLIPPQRVEADDQSCATVISWDASTTAVRYDVYRAPFTRTSSTVPRANAAPALPNALNSTTLLSQFAGPAQVPGGTWIAGQSTKLASTTNTYYLDTSAPAGSSRNGTWWSAWTKPAINRCSPIRRTRRTRSLWST